jgi:DUF3047 family protein
MIKIFFMVFTLLYSTVSVSLLQAEEVFLNEQFSSLERWQALHFSKIENHSSYSTSVLDGTSCLTATTSNSASALRLKDQFNVYDFPNIAWRFKVSNIYKKGDSSKKEGDDYPVRLFAMFEYDPEKVSLGMKVKYEIARIVDGEYPPHSSLNYIWANKKQSARFTPSPYSSLAIMIPVAAGQEKVGEWVEHKTNLVQDYRAAFGEDPPCLVTIAVMSDSDNTGESATAYIDYIKIYSE